MIFLIRSVIHDLLIDIEQKKCVLSIGSTISRQKTPKSVTSECNQITGNSTWGISHGEFHISPPN